MEWNNLSLRIVSYVGQKLPTDTIVRIDIFLKSVVIKENYIV